MDYKKLFSDDVPSFMKSPVREIFRVVDLSSIYSFAGGYPDASTFPIEDIKRLSSLVLEKYGTRALQYGATQGIPELREQIARRYGVSADNVLITTSSQQGIDVSSRIMLNPGDTVLTTAPTYLGALQSFKSYRANVVTLDQFAGSEAEQEEIPQGTCHPRPAPKGKLSLGGQQGDSFPACRGTASAVGSKEVSNFCEPAKISDSFDSPGVSLPAGASLPKFCYIIPDFQNPSGETMTLEERQRLVDLARKWDFAIVEDSPYRDLRYSGEPVPTIYSLAPERTLHLGSFSKIFAPGFRLGWIIGPPEFLEQIYICKQCLDLCPPIFNQYLAAEFIAGGAMEKNLARSIGLYREKRDLMLSLLEKYMPEGVSWTHPEGGLFLFLTLPEHIDTVALYDRALKAGVAYVAGSFFYPDGSHRNTMRLNFSYLDSSRMEPGIKILAEIIGSRVQN
ncbi:MAG: PLP-dependent aminotransferase family protein [Bacteroidales bacterium]|nr:PLP-dependent aminotransferase family protein [Bacteroidales bacterium]